MHTSSPDPKGDSAHSTSPSTKSTFGHALVLGSQSLSHLSPLLDPSFSPPRQILITDADRYESAIHLRALLNSRNVHVDIWLTPTERGVESVTNALSQQLERETDPIALNLSGGDPLLSFIAQSTFNARGFPVFYCQGSNLYRFSPKMHSIRLSPALELPTLMTAFGVKSTQGHSTDWFEDHLERLCPLLIDHCETYTSAFSLLHSLAETARATLTSVQVKGTSLMTPGFQELIEEFERTGSCELQRGCLTFSSEANRFFCAGGWLALYSASYIHKVAELVTLYDMKLGLEVSLPNASQVIIDLACVVEDKLYLFMCPQADDRSLHVQFDFYKQLKDRVPVEAIVLSALPLSIEMKRRAEDLSVHLCTHHTLRQMDAWIRTLFGLTR
jgi:hypothetical protein